MQFESQRIDHPDRVFFDLAGTELNPSLMGKTLDVDDGLLKKIRLAQYQPGRSRIVLEMDGESAYDAVLLTNPARLVIDIRNKQAAKAIVVKQDILTAKAKPAPVVKSKIGCRCVLRSTCNQNSGRQ